MADPKANDKQGYHQFLVYEEGDSEFGDGMAGYGSFEVFWLFSNDNEGWYWWACFPGCMPDGEASGPFATSQEAYDNAQEGA